MKLATRKVHMKMRAKKSVIAETKVGGISVAISKFLESRDKLKPYPSP